MITPLTIKAAAKVVSFDMISSVTIVSGQEVGLSI